MTTPLGWVIEPPTIHSKQSLIQKTPLKRTTSSAGRRRIELRESKVTFNLIGQVPAKE